MMRCSKKCREQWRLKCRKLEWQKQKKRRKERKNDNGRKDGRRMRDLE